VIHLNNNYAIESFISYCDDMMIVTEGFKEELEKVKAWLIKQFNRILDWLYKAVSKMKDTHFKVERNNWKIKLMNMIKRAKLGLSKSKSLNNQNPELANKLKQEVEDLDKEIKELDQNPAFRAMKNGAKKALGIYKETKREANHKTYDININFNKNKKTDS